MRTAYKVLAYIVAAEVAVQAMVMVWAIAGLGVWVDKGGVFDKSIMESEALPFTEVIGIIVHGINGTFVIPALALALLIVSFFTKVRGAIKWAAIVLLLTVAQGQIGFLGHEFPLAGALHGLNALALFGVALYTGRRIRTASQRGATPAEAPVRRLGLVFGWGVPFTGPSAKVSLRVTGSTRGERYDGQGEAGRLGRQQDPRGLDRAGGDARDH